MGQFTVGNIVRLKSGSPDMTILEKHFDKNAALYNQPQPEGYFLCGWFEKDIHHKEVFHQDVLVLAKRNA